MKPESVPSPKSRFVSLAIDHFTIPAADSQLIRTPSLRQIITPSLARLGPMNVVTSFKIKDEAEIERRIDTALQPYLPIQATPWWVVPERSPRLEEALSSRGFRLNHEAYGLSAPSAREGTELAAGVSVEELGERNLDDYLSVNFPPHVDREPIRAYFRQALAREAGRLTCFLARYEGRPAGTAVLHDLGEVGNLGSGYVLEQFRKLGVYRSLVDYRLRRLREVGLEHGVVLANQATSGPILLRLGFEIVTRFKVYELSPSSSTTRPR